MSETQNTTVATSLLGAMGPFDPTTTQWSSYVERMEEFLLANNVTEPRRKVAILLSTVGSQTYDLLRDLCSPGKPSSKTFDELIEILQNHLDPKPTVIAERYRFHQRNQEADESIPDYLAALRRLTKNCNFGTFLEEALRDRFVCGVRDEPTRRRLLLEKDLTIAKAVEIAQAMESVSKDVTSMSIPNTAVNTLRDRKPRSNPCYRCGNVGHLPQSCKFLEAKCFSCGKTGHIASVCRVKRKARPQPQRQVEEDPQENLLDLNTLQDKPEAAEPKAMLKVSIDAKEISMELDTGAAVSIVSRDKVTSPLRRTTKRLRSATGQLMKLAGEVVVKVQVGNQTKTLKLYVAQGNCPSLFGRGWIRAFFGNEWLKRLTHSAVHSVEDLPISVQLQQLLDKYANTVFQPGLGKVEGITAHLTLKAGSQPKMFKPRPVPYALRPRLEATLDQMETEGSLEKIDHCEWATPVVPVIKPDGTIRVCGDYKVTLNPCLQVPQHPLPRVEDCFHAMNGGRKFSKVDLSQAYNQIMMDEESMNLTTISTHKGLYRWRRLPYGVASSPAIFQGTIDQVLQGLDGVVWYMDDILVTGKTDEEHLKHLSEVLARLEKHGLRGRKEKCAFFRDSVEYLGHIIDKNGISPIQSKVEALLKAPAPTNIGQLGSFLGMINYYNRFIPNMSTLAAPLYRLRQKDVPWNWGAEEEEAFQQLKEALASSNILVHYDPKLPIKLDCDASSVGIGAVLSHVMADGTERPIAYASRSLNKAERNYSQIEKEALSLVWGVKKFYMHLYLREFTLVTDHKALTSLLSPSKGIPTMAASRLRRWALILMGYQYRIQFRSTGKHANADALSRLPQAETVVSSVDGASIHQVRQIEATYLDVQRIASGTHNDPLLSKVLLAVRKGWPETVTTELMPYFHRRDELTVEQDCLLWGTRVVIPAKLQPVMLKLLHDTHPGMVRMKALARSYVWWPGINKALENVVRNCQPCQQTRNEPRKAPLHPLEFPARPWQRVHLDFAGPFQGRMWLIVVDAYSKYPEVIPMTTTTATKTIQELHLIFARWGLPEQLVSDNGPQFLSDEFAEFSRSNGIKHIRVAPYHPSSNGAAERFVQTFKRTMKAMAKEGGDQIKRLANFLLLYRNTPQATTMEAPAMLLMKRIPRNQLDLIQPSLRTSVENKQMAQKKAHDKHAQERTFQPNQRVWVRDYRGPDKWALGDVITSTGPVSYEVDVTGQTWRRHADQIRAGATNQTVDSSSPTGSGETGNSMVTPDLTAVGGESASEQSVNHPVAPPPAASTNLSPPLIRQKSARVSRPPNRLDYSRPGQQVPY